MITAVKLISILAFGLAMFVAGLEVGKNMVDISLEIDQGDAFWDFWSVEDEIGQAAKRIK